MNSRSERRDHTRDINPRILGTPSQVRGGCMLGLLESARGNSLSTQ
jgi:hypothetical protein